MVKSGLEILFWNPSIRKPFFDHLIYFIKGRICASDYKFSNKNDILCAWRDFITIL